MSYASLKIHRMGWFYCARDWSWESRGQSVWPGQNAAYLWNWDVWTVMQGRGKLQINGQPYDLASGDCFVLKGTDHHIATHDPSDPLTVVAIHFDYMDNSKKPIFKRQHPVHRKIDDLAFFTHLLERADKTWHHHNTDSSIAEFWLRACLVEMEQQDKYDQMDRPTRQQAYRIDKLGKTIRGNPEKNYSIDDLAKSIGYTRRHFTRLFKEFQGVSPQEFIVTARIDKAKALLHASNYSVARIAELTGYSDVYFFSRHFKAKTGVAPTQYRCHEKN